jgi:hypothetical protein
MSVEKSGVKLLEKRHSLFNYVLLGLSPVGGATASFSFSTSFSLPFDSGGELVTIGGIDSARGLGEATRKLEVSQ